VDEKRAREVLDPYLDLEDQLHSTTPYVNWPTYAIEDDGTEVRSNKITLDGRFTPVELEAIAWWMRNGCTPTK
jgi:hypothetical protein